MKAILSLIGILALLLGNSCEKGTVVYSLNEDIRLYKGQPVKIGETENLQLEATEITDSRCPENVTCIWEGYAAATLKISQNGESIKTVDLCLGGCNVVGKQTKETVTIDGTMFEIAMKEINATGDKSYAVVQVKKI